MAKEVSAQEIASAVVNVIDDEFIRVSWGKIAAAATGVFAAGMVTGAKLYKRWQIRKQMRYPYSS